MEKIGVEQGRPEWIRIDTFGWWKEEIKYFKNI
jgi:hypothetical protein